MTRRTLLAALTSAALVSAAAPGTTQTGDDFPNRPIRILVPAGAGSGGGLEAGGSGQEMGEALGQEGVGGKRPGANAIIRMGAGPKAGACRFPPDFPPVSAVTTNAFIYKKLP